MAHQTVNVLLTSFPGLGLPPTLSHPVVASTSIADLISQLTIRIPRLENRFILTTTSNKEVAQTSSASISSLLSSESDTFLPLRLSVPLCGGKGGFGSQLRAAGGRMSSRRKKNQGDANSSNRNLDGRRLRTIAEAKALAEYLALKPEMEKKDKEARRKRWEQVVELAEKREGEVRNGSKGRVDGKWVEENEDARERAREAVLAAMKSGDHQDNLKHTSSGSSGGGSAESSEGSEDEHIEKSIPGLGTTTSTPKSAAAPARSYYGFEDDDEFMSSEDKELSDEDAEDEVQQERNQGEMVAALKPEIAGKGKGKIKA